MSIESTALGGRMLKFQIPMLQGGDVATVQAALVAAGLLDARHADSRYNLYTRRAILALEKEKGLSPAGFVPEGDQSAIAFHLNRILDPLGARGPMVVTDAPLVAVQPEKVIDPSWLDNAKMDRIIVHWTAGNNRASEGDQLHYHFLIEDDGKIIRGKWRPADNTSTADGRYAAHTLNTNTRSIGVALCGMTGARERPFRAGSQPITAFQWQVMAKAVAQLCEHYGIPVSEKTVLGHGEVQRLLGIRQRQKWDPMVLPWDTGLSQAAVGEKLREDVRAALAGQADDGIRPMDATVSGTDLPGGAVTYDAKTWVSLKALVDGLGWHVLDREAADGVIVDADGTDIFVTAFTHVAPESGAESVYLRADDLAEALNLKMIVGDFGTALVLSGKTGGSEKKVSTKQYRAVTIRRGDFLTKIALRLLGDKARWTDILDEDAKPFTEETARHIKPGDQVLVPLDNKGSFDASPGAPPIPEADIKSLARRIAEAARPGNHDRALKAFPVIMQGCQKQKITDPAHLAYVLATAEHETNFGAVMEETWGPSARQRRYDNRYGNTRPGDGKKYRGRGYVQLTFKGNYKRFGDKLKINLVDTPEKAADPKTAADVLAIGMSELGYRSRNLILREYGFGDDFDFVNARGIVNADVNEHERRYGATRGEGIASQAVKYFEVLK